MMQDLLSHKTAILLTLLISLMVLERAFPAVILRSQLERLTRNFSFAAFNILLSPFIVVPLTFYASNAALHWRPEWATGWVIDLLLLDCWIYFWHRINHRIPFLWRFHEVHHLDENLDVSSAVRFHFGEVILSSLVRAGVILIFGIPIQSVLVFEILVTAAALFHHSNIKIPHWLERPLSFVIVTPSIHFVHHHAVRTDTDSNYSTILSVWDRLFGSSNKTERTAHFKVGVEGLGDAPLLRLILRPFYRA